MNNRKRRQEYTPARPPSGQQNRQPNRMQNNQNSPRKNSPKNNSKRKNPKLFRFVCLVILVFCVTASTVALLLINKNEKKAQEKKPKTTTQQTQKTNDNNAKSSENITAVTTAKILSTGDILIHEPQLKGALVENDTYNFSQSFSYIDKKIKEADFAVCNLETTLGGADKNYSSYPLSSSPDSLIDALKGAGFGMVLTANNHAYDTGIQGLVRTSKVIAQKGLLSTGTRADVTDKAYAVREINGIKIGFLNYTYETKPDATGKKILNGNALSDEANDLVNTFNYDNLDAFYADVEEKIASIKNDGAQAIMLYLHWGTEYKSSPDKHQKTIANKMCDLGIDILIGSHPHIIQPLEIIKSKTTGNVMPCLYSVGNVLSNQRASLMELKTGHTEDGVLIYTTFTKYSDGKVKITSLDYVPTWVNIATIESKKIHQIIPLDNIIYTTQGLGLTTQNQSSARASHKRTKEILDSGIGQFNNQFKK